MSGPFFVDFHKVVALCCYQHFEYRRVVGMDIKSIFLNMVEGLGIIEKTIQGEMVLSALSDEQLVRLNAENITRSPSDENDALFGVMNFIRRGAEFAPKDEGEFASAVDDLITFYQRNPAYALDALSEFVSSQDVLNSERLGVLNELALKMHEQLRVYSDEYVPEEYAMAMALSFSKFGDAEYNEKMTNVAVDYFVAKSRGVELKPSCK